MAKQFIKSAFLGAMMLLGLSASVSAQDKEQFCKVGNRVGVGVGVGTEGIGIDAAVSLTSYVQARVGVNIFPNIKFNTDVDVSAPATAAINGQEYTYDVEGTTNVEGKFGRTTVDVKFDVYPFGARNAFFLTAGLSFGGNDLLKVTGTVDDNLKNEIATGKKLGVDIGDYNIPIDENGEIHGGVKVNSVRPYLGLGFGRLIPKNRVGFRFELGAQFQGKPKVYADGVGDLMEQNFDKEAKDDISKVMDWLRVYPVLKLSIRGRIL